MMSGEQERVKKPHFLTALLTFLLVPIIVGAALGVSALPLSGFVTATTDGVSKYWNSLPEELPSAPLPQRSRILDAKGKVMATFFAENRITVSLDTVSPFVVDALVSVEDRKFFEHDGIDWRGIGRAALNNAQNDGGLQGASTITQQLVKNTLVINAATDEERIAATQSSVYRKLQEVKYARYLEENFSKDEILEKYLNAVLYSNGVYGIGTAAEYYFDKKAKELTLAEAALLVGLLKNPSGYDPIDNPEQAVERRNVVLSTMLANNKITKAEFDATKAEKLELNLAPAKNGCATARDPYYCQRALNDIKKDPALGATQEERDATLYRGGLIVKTHFNASDYKKAQKTVDEALGRDNRVATSIAVVEPGTGIVKAIAQNRTWGNEKKHKEGKPYKTEVIYADRAAFQSGSTFKVFTLAAALESGFPVNGTLNAPSTYDPEYMNVPKGGIKNLSSVGAGNLSLYQGTARSSNTFYALLAEKVGVLNVADLVASMGIDVPREGSNAVGAKDASFTLGTISVSPLQMSAAYAAFAAGGIYCEPVFIESVTLRDGTELDVRDGNCRRVVSEQTAANVSSILSSVISGDDEYRTAKDVKIGRKAAGKTGTTNGYAAVWFAGYTPQAATAVWVGDPRGGQKYPLSSGLRFYGWWTNDVWGSTISGPIWESVMKKMHEGVEKQSFPRPGGQSVGNVIPDVRGMEVQKAVSVLQENGYTVTISDKQAKANEFSSPNHVASQSPKANGDIMATRSTNITLVLTHDSDNWDLPADKQ